MNEFTRGGMQADELTCSGILKQLSTTRVQSGATFLKTTTVPSELCCIAIAEDASMAANNSGTARAQRTASLWEPMCTLLGRIKTLPTVNAICTTTSV